MSEGEKPAEQAHSVESIVRLLRRQITQEFDAYRMRKCWPAVLSEADPQVVAEALVRVLSHGQYVAREARPVLSLSITCNGAAPVAIVGAMAKATGAGCL